MRFRKGTMLATWRCTAYRGTSDGSAGGCCDAKRMGLGLGFPRTFKGLGLSGSIFGSRLILVVGPLGIGLGLILFWVLNLGLSL
ncbi:hypothetical protein V6Z12_A06G206000 [Gossypium hirsutum]